MNSQEGPYKGKWHRQVHVLCVASLVHTPRDWAPQSSPPCAHRVDAHTGPVHGGVHTHPTALAAGDTMSTTSHTMAFRVMVHTPCPEHGPCVAVTQGLPVNWHATSPTTDGSPCVSATQAHTGAPALTTPVDMEKWEHTPLVLCAPQGRRFKGPEDTSMARSKSRVTEGVKGAAGVGPNVRVALA